MSFFRRAAGAAHHRRPALASPAPLLHRPALASPSLRAAATHTAASAAPLPGIHPAPLLHHRGVAAINQEAAAASPLRRAPLLHHRGVATINQKAAAASPLRRAPLLHHRGVAAINQEAAAASPLRCASHASDGALLRHHASCAAGDGALLRHRASAVGYGALLRHRASAAGHGALLGHRTSASSGALCSQRRLMTDQALIKAEIDQGLARVEAASVARYMVTGDSINVLKGKVADFTTTISDQNVESSLKVGRVSLRVCGLVLSGSALLGVTAMQLIHFGGDSKAKASVTSHVDDNMEVVKKKLDQKAEEFLMARDSKKKAIYAANMKLLKTKTAQLDEQEKKLEEKENLLLERNEALKRGVPPA